MKPPGKKTLGRTSGSLNAPIAAFTMAIILCSYCFSSIHTARREAQSGAQSIRSPRERAPDSPQWVQQALEESREVEKKRSK